MKLGLMRGSVLIAVAWTSAATAQVPPSAAAPRAGTSSAPKAAPAPVDPGAAPVDDAAPPAAPEVTPPAAAADSPPSREDEDDEEERAAKEKEREEAEEEERRRIRRRRLRAEQEREDSMPEPATDVDEEQESPPSRVSGSHFILSIERITSIFGWSETLTAEIMDGSGNSTTAEIESSGTGVSLLASGALSGNVLATPRVGFDGAFDNGFTLGGSLGYMRMGSETTATGTSGTSETNQNPTREVFLFAPRLGVIIPASSSVGIWLRGGITRLSASSENEGDDIDSSSALTLVDLTLDPQIVVSPIAHVGLMFGATLDIGLSGSIESTVDSTTVERDVTMSSYGVSAGLAAIF